MSGIREIAFDTETTGFEHDGDDRITEIGCVELIDFIPTGKTWHSYINPERSLPEKVTEITGLTEEFLKDKPLFIDIIDDFLEFVGNSNLVAHNAEFDRNFINAELFRCNKKTIPEHKFIDTLVLAREKFPGSRNSLDALCKRFDISLSSRTTHGALVDAHLLAKVYLELNGGKARSLDLKNTITKQNIKAIKAKPRQNPLGLLSSEEEIKSHEEFIKKALGEKALWNRSFKTPE